MATKELEEQAKEALLENGINKARDENENENGVDEDDDRGGFIKEDENENENDDDDDDDFMPAEKRMKL